MWIWTSVYSNSISLGQLFVLWTNSVRNWSWDFLRSATTIGKTFRRNLWPSAMSFMAIEWVKTSSQGKLWILLKPTFALPLPLQCWPHENEPLSHWGLNTISIICTIAILSASHFCFLLLIQSIPEGTISSHFVLCTDPLFLHTLDRKS